MAKLTLLNVTSLTNESSALATLNNNNNSVEVALENTLSRDGTAPNSMAAALDMNSNRILNLPTPIASHDPVRLSDLSAFSGKGLIIGPYVNVQDYGALGDNVTDNTTAFNAAITALAGSGFKGGTLFVPPAQGFYSFWGTINFNTKSGITLVGTAGVVGPAGPTSLLYQGSGSRFIDCRDSGGIRIKDLGIAYNNPAFTGYVIDGGGNTVATGSTFGSVSSALQVDNCQIYPIGAVHTIQINLDQSIEARITNNSFSTGAPSIKGCYIIAGNSTVCYFAHNQYVNNVGTAIIGCGEAWMFVNETFEASNVGTANAFTTYGNIGGRGCSFIDCWFGDVTATGGIWVTYTGQSFNFIGNRISGISPSCEAINLYTCNGASITGNDFNSFSGAIDFATSGANSAGIVVSGNYFENITSAPFVNLSKVTGLIAEGNTPSTSQYTSGQVAIGQTGADATPKTISGDATLSAAGAVTLATVATAATTGSSTAIPVVTVDVKGRVTTTTTAAVIAPAGTLTGTTLASGVTASSLTSFGVAPALGTPASGVATNLTGTAASLTAGHVTTNANLTGPITSVGNATTIASLATGTGLPLTTGVTGILPIANGGTNSSVGAVVTIKRQIFTASGTYTPSAGMLYAILEGVGGGGGGGGAVGLAGGYMVGGGGGGGGYARLIASATTIGASKAVTIGAAGAASTAGANSGGAGGATSVGSLLIANGGSGGTFTQSGVQNGAGGTGGSAGTGDISPQGQAGLGGAYLGASGFLMIGTPGAGGNSPFGSGSLGCNGAFSSYTGTSGTGYGAGGGGAVLFESATNGAGGPGTAGFVIVTEFCNQ